MNEKDFAELSAGYALHALSPDDERAFRAARAAHPEWASLTDLDDEAAASLADGFGEEAPPAETRAALLAKIANLPQLDPTAPKTHPGVALSLPIPSDDVDVVDAGADAADPDATHVVDVIPAEDIATSVVPTAAAPVEPVAETASDAPADAKPADAEPVDDEPALPPVPAVPAAAAAEAEPVPSTAPPTEVVQTIQRKNWTRGLFALVASAALLVGIGWGVGAIVDQVRTPIEIQALKQIEAAADVQSVVGQFSEGGEATVHWSETVGKAVLTTDETPSIDDDRSFELWVIRGDDAPVAAGVFEPGEDVTALIDGDVEAGDTIAVTVEAQGGSPDGTPTTDPIIAIATNPGDES
ncbi:anti-sigma factor [Microbacterium dauci]|uniref:Regulator of SigK n=1 Tax=Microbacterium dauci TaxID=3048008 RepID=A0ABT6ZFL6_9MICO|nr:anti-sigma factor [Microbacterium sp. LX3-4]MDJ1114953.1 anti-sigma factor [Microbacterium sp. LX3-4]